MAMHIELRNEMASIGRRLIDSTRKVHIQRCNKMCAEEFIERKKIEKLHMDVERKIAL